MECGRLRCSCWSPCAGCCRRDKHHRPDRQRCQQSDDGAGFIGLDAARRRSSRRFSRFNAMAGTFYRLAPVARAIAQSLLADAAVDDMAAHREAGIGSRCIRRPCMADSSDFPTSIGRRRALKTIGAGALASSTGVNLFAEGTAPAPVPHRRTSRERKEAAGMKEAAQSGAIRPDLCKRGQFAAFTTGAIASPATSRPSSITDPSSVETLFPLNDVDLYDLARDPWKQSSLALDRAKYRERNADDARCRRSPAVHTCRQPRADGGRKEDGCDRIASTTVIKPVRSALCVRRPKPASRRVSLAARQALQPGRDRPRRTQ